MLIGYSAAALRDIEAIAQIIVAERPTAATAFLNAMSALELMLREQPEAGRRTQLADTRRWLMSD